MLFFYLILAVHGSDPLIPFVDQVISINAIPKSNASKVANNKTKFFSFMETSKVPKVTNNKTKFSSFMETFQATPSIIETIKANPAQFVAEAQKFDPEGIRSTIILLQGLKTDSEAAEDQLVTALNDANTELNDANAALLDANRDVEDANLAIQAIQEFFETGMATKEQQLSNAETVLEDKKAAHHRKQGEQDVIQKDHDNTVPRLNDEQQTLSNVITLLEETIVWYSYQEVANVGTHTNPDASFWNNHCQQFPDLTPQDIILVHMGEVKDYFHPGKDMSLCYFLLHQDYTWCATEDGTYVRPDMYGSFLGGSRGSLPGSIDGRSVISFWGGNGANGGCCFYKSTIYGGAADGAAWQRAFTLSVKYV